MHTLWLVHTARDRDREKEWETMGSYILHYVLYILHMDRARKPLFYIVRILFPVPVPFPVLVCMSYYKCCFWDEKNHVMLCFLFSRRAEQVVLLDHNAGGGYRKHRFICGEKNYILTLIEVGNNIKYNKTAFQ